MNSCRCLWGPHAFNIRHMPSHYAKDTVWPDEAGLISPTFVRSNGRYQSHGSG